MFKRRHEKGTWLVVLLKKYVIGSFIVLMSLFVLYSMTTWGMEGILKSIKQGFVITTQKLIEEKSEPVSTQKSLEQQEEDLKINQEGIIERDMQTEEDLLECVEQRSRYISKQFLI